MFNECYIILNIMSLCQSQKYALSILCTSMTEVIYSVVYNL